MQREQEKSWFQKNWWWAVPGCGCLSILLLGAITCGGLGFFGLQKLDEINNEVFGAAIEQAKSHPAVIEVTGEPIDVDFGGSFSIRMEGGKSVGERDARLSGPDGSGRLFIEMIKRGELWEVEGLWFEPSDSGGQDIDLLNDGSTGGDAP